MLFLHVLQVCFCSTAFLTANSYVLFSANIDDFKNLARKFVSKNLALKLTELVNESSMPKRQDRDGGEERKTEIDKDKPWQIIENQFLNVRMNYERDEEETGKGRDATQAQTETTAVESLFEPDRMHEKDYDRLEDSTFPELVDKRYKTVQRMPTTKDWFEEPPSFVNTMYPNIDKPDTPSHSIYYKEPNDNVKKSSPEIDINVNYEPFKETENSKVGRDERSNGKQMQYFPVENKIHVKKQTNETERVRVNERDVSRIKQRKIKKLERKGDETSIFETVVMGKKKDSYEDYVTPEKGDDYLSDGIGPTTKRRPIPSIQKSLKDRMSPATNSWSYKKDFDDGIDKTTKSWPILSNIGYGISSTTRKEPVWSVESELIDTITSSTRKRPMWSGERNLRDRKGPTTKERPAWDQRDLSDGFTKKTKRPILALQRERTVKTTITKEETFPDYVEREWMTTKRNRPTENDREATERETTTEKPKATEEYVLEDEPDNNKPVYEVNKNADKARTESLLFDSKEIEDNNQTSATRYTMKGTGVPTREYYKMSTPDYYNKLPRIVEKYDFNEPIPEADREREKVDDRHAQEPARVNKKIKQQHETEQEEKPQQERTHQGKVGAVEKIELKAGPLESILENIGFRFKG